MTGTKGKEDRLDWLLRAVLIIAMFFFLMGAAGMAYFGAKAIQAMNAAEARECPAQEAK